MELMMKSSDLEIFFSKLAARLRTENNLSDITWAMCEAFPDFKRLFINFFFSEVTEVAGVVLTREFAKEVCRPDFHFEWDKVQFIIEVKKYDRNYHFDEYKKMFDKVRFGWIANYPMQQVENVEIRTWRSFKDFLEGELSNGILDASLATAIISYCQYLKVSCSIVKFKKMNLQGLSSLYLFNKIIEKVIEEYYGDVECSVYSQARGIWEDRSGKIFTVTRNETPDKRIYPWFGIYYGEDKVCICMGFSKAWCGSVFNGVSQSPTEGTTYLQAYFDEREYWFEMRPKLFEEFNNMESPDDQEKLLTNFFNEVINDVKKFL